MWYHVTRSAYAFSQRRLVESFADLDKFDSERYMTTFSSDKPYGMGLLPGPRSGKDNCGKKDTRPLISVEVSVPC